MMMYLNREAHTDLANQFGAFEENNICSEFIKFIASNSDNLRSRMKDYEFDDEKVVNLLNIVNGIIQNKNMNNNAKKCCYSYFFKDV